MVVKGKISSLGSSLRNDRAPIILGLGLRFLIFAFVCVFPLPWGVEGRISPLLYSDHGLHLFFELIDLFSGDTSAHLRFTEAYWNIMTGALPEIRYPGPVLALFIWLTNYSEGNPGSLAMIMFLMECVTFVGWQKHITKKVGVALSLPFAFLPNIMWFGLIVSSDLLFYFFSSIVLLKVLDGQGRLSAPVIFLTILAVMSRPVGLTLPAFLMIGAFFPPVTRSTDKRGIVAMAIILVIGVLYYSPYFFTEQMHLERFSPVVLFLANHGVLDDGGLFFATAKFFLTVLFLFGIHPSESQLFFATLIRGITGATFFVGLLYMLKSRDRVLIYVLGMLLPIIFLFSPQWRYLLPIMPIMFLYFLLFLSRVFSKEEISETGSR